MYYIRSVVWIKHTNKLYQFKNTLRSTNVVIFINLYENVYINNSKKIQKVGRQRVYFYSYLYELDFLAKLV